MADKLPRRDPEFRVRPGPEPREMTARYAFNPIDVYLHWGDGTDRQILHVNELLHHTYDRPGAYRVRIRTLGTLALIDEATVVIRDIKHPEVTVAEHPGHPGVLVAQAPAELDATGIVPGYRVFWAWPSQTDFDDFWGVPNAAIRKQLAPGRHRVRVRDLGTQRDIETPHDIAEPDLAFTLAVDGRVVTLTVDKANQDKQLVVSWGDITPTEPVTDKTATHTYPSTADTTYLVQLVYADNSGWTAKPVVIPGGSP